MNNLFQYEKDLYNYMKIRLKTIPKVKIYAENSNQINIPYISFNIKGMYHTDVANYLAYNHGIEVAAGSAGADIYVQSLLGVSAEDAYAKYLTGKPYGIIRVSLGMYNSFSEVDSFINALKKL